MEVSWHELVEDLAPLENKHQKNNCYFYIINLFENIFTCDMASTSNHRLIYNLHIRNGHFCGKVRTTLLLGFFYIKVFHIFPATLWRGHFVLTVIPPTLLPHVWGREDHNHFHCKSPDKKYEQCTLYLGAGWCEDEIQTKKWYYNKLVG